MAAALPHTMLSKGRSKGHFIALSVSLLASKIVCSEKRFARKDQREIFAVRSIKTSCKNKVLLTLLPDDGVYGVAGDGTLYFQPLARDCRY
jgi:hypothetical protein